MDKRIEELEMEQTQRGFNQGYLLAKHKPELYALIASGIEKDKLRTPYLTGFTRGGKQYENEKQKEQQKKLDKPKQEKQVSKPPIKSR